MSISICPTDVVAARPERIWSLLTEPAELAAWSGSKLIEGPNRTLIQGDRIVLGPGFGMRVTLVIVSMAPLRELGLDACLPLGVVNHEVVQLSPMDGARCRVTLN